MSKNSIIEEQRRAREEFLRLKRMENGEEAPEPKPSEQPLKPRGFKEKRQNFWYHYRWHTVAAVIIAVAVGFFVTDMLTRERFDMQMVCFSYDAVTDAQLSAVEEYFEEKISDIDGNGEVSIRITNCSFEGDSESEYKSVMLSKIQTILFADDSTVMFIIDEEAADYLSAAAGNSEIFETEPLPLGEDFYEATEDAELGALTKGLMIAVRKTDGSLFEKNENIGRIADECRKIIEEMK